VETAEIYSVKMIEIIEGYINSMGNQYSFIANIHIGVMYFIMKQYERANMLFKEILEQEFEYVDSDKSHPFLEQIYLHLAIMYQSLEQHNSALVMWKSLLKVHKQAYSAHSNYISKDYCNIGR
jgi:tetratricopeptide (TPR) repeat protein